MSSSTASRRGRRRGSASTTTPSVPSIPGIITCSITAYGEHPVHRDRPGYDGLVAARTGLLYDQKGRRGTAMEFINGRPGPYPEFGAPEGLVRGADRDGPIFPRTPWPSIGATYFATLGIAAALRARQVSGLGQRVTTSLLQGALAAVVPELAAGREPGCAAVLDVARRLEVDRGSLRMCGRQMGPSLDAAPPVGPGRGRRGHALGRRAGHVVPGRPGSCLDGARRDVDGHLPPPATGGGVQEVPGRRVGPSGRGGGSRYHDRPVAGGGAGGQVVPRRRLCGRGRRSRTWDRFAMPDRCWSSRRRRVPSPGRRPARANTPTRCWPRPVPASARPESCSAGPMSRSRIPWRVFGSSTSGSGWRGRSRGVSSPTSEPTSSRSTRCTTPTGTARTWVSARTAGSAASRSISRTRPAGRCSRGCCSAPT